MNDTERRELNIWLHEALGNCAHEWRCDIVWKENGKYLYNSGQVNATCKKCGATTEDTFTALEDLQAPDYTGRDWPALAEAMRQRGCWVKIILRPDSHKSAHKYYCEIEHRGEEWSYHANADTPGEAVALASKSALEAEVS